VKYYLILSTVPSQKIGERIARLLVRNHMAACVNVVAGVRSYFWWEGKVSKARESLLIIKTTRRRFQTLSKFLKKIHPYHVPEIIGLPIEKVNPSYLQWMENVLGRL